MLYVGLYNMFCVDNKIYIRSEVFMVVTMKNVFWDVMPCGSCKNQCFGGM
jgi:hypothetical protein